MRIADSPMRRQMADLIRQFNTFATFTLGMTMVLANCPMHVEAASATTPNPAPTRPYMAQVVGLQWLNPLERMDYPTEWQLLWTLGLVKPNLDISASHVLGLIHFGDNYDFQAYKNAEPYFRKGADQHYPPSLYWYWMSLTVQGKHNGRHFPLL